MKKRKIVIFSIIILLCLITFFLFKNEKSELKNIKSEKELLNIYNCEYSNGNEIFYRIIGMPFSFGSWVQSRIDSSIDEIGSANGLLDSVGTNSSSSSGSLKGESSSKEYSTTNIQVENVDEADITKTDGDYIYSISENNVIITNVKNPSEVKIESKITDSKGIPEDLILYDNKLVVILAYQEKNQYNTIVNIYNIEDKTNPQILKNYEMYEPYYTSRCINNQLYVISSGKLRKENDKIVRAYKENSIEQKIEFDKMYHLKDVKTNKQTIISTLDLENVADQVDISSYLIDISNAYVSENNIYLLEQKYKNNSDNLPIWKLFGPKGVIGFFESLINEDYSRDYATEIFKFDISKNGKVTYDSKNKIDGKTINQYSLDEKEGHLRVALYDNKGARVVIFDENLKQIGATSYVASGEKMYSSRFMGDKAYLVTYKTIDPLFVIDLSDEKNPKVLGELHIPGYSTYLHPYDENHLIGIGMETEEVINRNSSGKVISTTSKIIGMKMALFDVSDVNNPIQISQTVIGDRRTTSAILTNPKALLFSKEKQLIAIPVNNYSEEFSVNSYDNNYSSMINAYSSYNKSYIAEGYFVYKINLEEGFNLKGIITHDTSAKKYSSYYYNNSKLLRGLYIDDNIYTVSENAIKVNRLDTLEQISELKIK